MNRDFGLSLIIMISIGIGTFVRLLLGARQLIRKYW